MDVTVHGLGDADVGADGGAEEVEDPEGGDDSHVEFAVVIVSWCEKLMMGEGKGIPVDSLDLVDVILKLLRRGSLKSCL